MKTAFQREIERQGEALRRMVVFYRNEGRQLLGQWKRILKRAHGNLIFTGMGTSFYTPLVIKSLLASEGVLATIFEAGELLNYELDVVHKDDLVVLISQSGESIETCKVAENLRGLCKSVAIVNDEASRLPSCADLVLHLKAGDETSITNRTYTNTLGLLNMMGVVALSQDLEKEMNSLVNASYHMDSFLHSRAEEITLAEQLLKDATTLHFLSRGPALVGAYQGALTFMEGARMTASAMPCGSFRHGPFELVGEEHHAIVYIPSSPPGRSVTRMVSEMAQKGSHIVAFSASSERIENPHVLEIVFLNVEDRQLPIAAATAQELLLDRIASRRGLTCGVFRHIAKVTRVE
ncbi:MAG: SIS domain-containing protein [Candidatus Bathyarchaeota archaeon]|nr:SIS domain-containing protein [Candidatus Bathyarchaeota archaeon]